MKQFVKDLVHSYEEPLKEIRHHLLSLIHI